MAGRIAVGVGDLAVSKDIKGRDSPPIPLGSCIAVIIHDAKAGVGGLAAPYAAHLFTLNPQRAASPAGGFRGHGFAESCSAAPINSVRSKGADESGAWLGEVRYLDEGGHFNIGKRNYAAVRKILYRNNVLVDKEDVGGNVNRTVGSACRNR